MTNPQKPMTDFDECVEKLMVSAGDVVAVNDIFRPLFTELTERVVLLKATLAERDKVIGGLGEVIKHGFFATTLDGVMYSRFGDKRTFWCIYRYCPDDGDWLLGECHPIRDFDEYEMMGSVGQEDLGFVVKEAEDECYFHGGGVYLDKAKAEAVFTALAERCPGCGNQMDSDTSVSCWSCAKMFCPECLQFGSGDKCQLCKPPFPSPSPC